MLDNFSMSKMPTLSMKPLVTAEIKSISLKCENQFLKMANRAHSGSLRNALCNIINVKTGQAHNTIFSQEEE